MPTNDFPIISRGTNKKVSPIKNPRSYYAPEIPQVNHNPVPQFGITGLHVEKFPMGDMKPYYGHSNNALTGLRANGATMFGRSLLGGIDLINIINEERDIARSDQPDWYREELERQKRKETGQFRRKDLFDNKYKIYADGGRLKKAYNPSEGEDPKFLLWYRNNTLEGLGGVPYNDPKQVYDFVSFYKNGEHKNADYGIEKHFPDTYKYPNHPTFSNESIYSTPEKPGGSWIGDNYNPNGKFKYNSLPIIKHKYK